MKYSIGLKILAFLLAAVSLAITLVSGLGIGILANQDLYTMDYSQWEEQYYDNRSFAMAQAVAESYAARNLGGLSMQELELIGWGNSHFQLSQMWGLDTKSWAYSVCSYSGQLLEKVHPMPTNDLTATIHRLQVIYPVQVFGNDVDDAWTLELTVDGEREKTILVQFLQSPEYEVMIWLTPGSLHEFNGVPLDFYRILAHFRYHLIGVAMIGLLMSMMCLAYLCFAAGRSSKKEGACPGGLNRLPLDLYGAALVGIVLILYLCLKEIVEEMLFRETVYILGAILAGGTVLAAALCVIAGIFALAAQWKVGKSYPFRHSLIGWCCGKVYGLCKQGGKGLCKLYTLLPLVWKYLLIAFGMAVVPLFAFFMCIVIHGFGRAFWMLVLFLAAVADIGLVCYGAYAYGTVLRGAKSMAEGDLRADMDTRYLRGSYKDCAENFNRLADVAEEAARKQMRSERMKAELVTNVSHDIKTPLTSVINYIDLLQKAQTPEQSAQYLEVLDRQAQKLKKLIEDLMEMSKATTGDMAVEFAKVDAVEAMTQALGEFADKLEKEELTVVFQKPETPVYIRADGKLLWRVLSNLMSNIVKYALPGTRVYAQVEQGEETVLLTLKNISREALNISAEELTERFVRGDTARNTEGSGLGLHIAKSLVELQKGTLALTVDGDLFKVSLTFPLHQ